MGGYAPGSAGSGGGGGGPLSGGQSISEFYEITNIPPNVDTDIFTYTVPVNKTLVLIRVDVTGNNIADYRLYFNNVMQKRSFVWFTDGLNGKLDFTVPTLGGLWLIHGTVIRLEVNHYRPHNGLFSSTLHGILL